MGLLFGCSRSSDQAQPDTSGGGNPMQESVLDACPNAAVIREAVPKAQKAVDDRAEVRTMAEAATRAFYTCSQTGNSDLTRDWAMLNSSYWLAHTALRDESGVKTLDESVKYLDFLASHTHYPEIHDGALRMLAGFQSDEESLKHSLARAKH